MNKNKLVSSVIGFIVPLIILSIAIFYYNRDVREKLQPSVYLELVAYESALDIRNQFKKGKAENKVTCKDIPDIQNYKYLSTFELFKDLNLSKPHTKDSMSDVLYSGYENYFLANKLVMTENDKKELKRLTKIDVDTPSYLFKNAGRVDIFDCKGYSEKEIAYKTSELTYKKINYVYGFLYDINPKLALGINKILGL